MTLESSLPYLSIGCAIGAGAAAAVGPSPGVQRTLKAVALLALAFYAFLRGMAPAALAMALVLSGLSQAAAPRDRAAADTARAGLATLAWLVFAWLCAHAGGGLEGLAAPLRLGLLVLALAVAGGALALTRNDPGSRRIQGWAETGALVLMLGAAFTLREAQWPAMAGAGAVLVAQTACMALVPRAPRNLRRAVEILPWLLSYLGQAAMAYVFLR